MASPVEEKAMCVKCRGSAAEFCVFLLQDAKPVFIHNVPQSDDTLWGHPCFPHHRPEPRMGGGVSGCLV